MSTAIPLTRSADSALSRLVTVSGSTKISELTGAGLLGERAMLGSFRIPGRTSAGGGCRMFETQNGAVALNLARADDREMLAALFAVEAIDAAGDDEIAAHMARSDGLLLTLRGREMGLAIASELESRSGATPAIRTVASIPASPPARQRPRVIDLSALWAGPLAAHLLWLTGADVIKVESKSRPDGMRWGDARFFALLNQGKASAALNLEDPSDRSLLLEMLADADIVIEAGRPRGLQQLGIEAALLARQTPGQVWVSITGHGVGGAAANWVGFGDDCGVAAGLAAAMRKTTGFASFVGDAVADPLTGIVAATTALEAWQAGAGGQYALSMRGVVAHALESERETRPDFLGSELIAWQKAEGRSFPPVPVRQIGTVASLGRDNRATWAAARAC